MQSSLPFPSLTRSTPSARTLATKGKAEVSLSAFAFLFSEVVQYCQTKVTNIGELERRLEDLGFGVGLRLLEVLCYRDRSSRREIRLLGALKFVHSSLWKYLFGHQAQDLEQSNTVLQPVDCTQNQQLKNVLRSRDKQQSHTRQCASQADDEYMISDNDLFVNRFISVPKDMGQLNCAAYVAGIVRGALEGAGFPARVTAHSVAVKDTRPRTTILMKFDSSVLQREQRLPSA